MAEERHSSERRFIVKVAFCFSAEYFTCCSTDLGHPLRAALFSTPPTVLLPFPASGWVGIGNSVQIIPHFCDSVSPHSNLVCITVPGVPGAMCVDSRWLREDPENLLEETEEADEYLRFTLI